MVVGRPRWLAGSMHALPWPPIQHAALSYAFPVLWPRAARLLERARCTHTHDPCSVLREVPAHVWALCQRRAAT